MKVGAAGRRGARGAPIEIVMSAVSIATVEQAVSPPTLDARLCWLYGDPPALAYGRVRSYSWLRAARLQGDNEATLIRIGPTDGA